MKKLVLSLAIASSLGLTACDSETVKDVQKEANQTGPVAVEPARVVFDPAAGIAGLSVPNDLIFSGTQDGTLEIPVEDPSNGADPFVAASALDGWSTSNPFLININFPEGRSLDEGSAQTPGAVRVFEAVMGGDSSDADCASVARGLACKIVGELTFGQDFVTQKSGNAVAFIPTKPLKGKTTYLFALTDSLTDSDGNSLAGSTTYELVRQDINTKPLGSDAQKALQATINSYEKAVVSAGVSASDIIYTMAMTTQSTVDVMYTVKSLMVNQPMPSVSVVDTGMSVADALDGKIPAEAIPLFSTANYLKGSITLPYYLGVPTAENPTAPVNTWWTGLCDSGAMLAGLAAQNPAAIPAEAVSETDAQCMAISQASGLPAPGLRDLPHLELDTERNLTKFNPVPKMNAMMPLEVQMTTPDLPVVNAVRASMGMSALTEPENGWPVVVLQHGITSQKEVMLNLAGVLSLNGFASVAIDYPLHGTRGFDLNGDGTDEINATTVSTLHYVNLGSMLTMRDNTRQSAIDIVGLRLGLNDLQGVDINGNAVNINSSEVHFLGHSLGAIYGINAVTLANTPLNPAIDGKFRFTTNILAMPGLMLANFGLESPAFESLAKSNLTLQSSDAFKALIAQMYPEGDYTQNELSGAYEQFYAALTPAQQAELDAVFAQFTLIAQTVTDSGDPVNYVQTLAATQTPTLLFEIVGDGMNNLSDQVVTNTAPQTPLGGTEPAIALLGLPGVSSTSQGSGAVRFVNGHHGTLLDPRSNAVSPDPEKSARATQEMQQQLASFLLSKGQLINVVDTEVIH